MTPQLIAASAKLKIGLKNPKIRNYHPIHD